GNHGDLSGFTSTTTRPGKIGQALDFDGSDDYVDAGSASGVPNGNNPRTVSIWFNADSFDTGTADTIISLHEGGSTGSGLWVFAEDNAVSIGFSGHRIISPKTTLLTGNWYHAVMIIPDGSTLTSDTLLYIDGVNQYLTDETGSAQTLNSDTVEVTVSSSDSIGADYFDGTIDDARVYNRALSADEINRLYHLGATTHINKTLNSNPDLQDGLVGHWTFDGANMNPNVRDISGQGNHGNLVGQTSTTTRPGKIGQALEFDGVNDSVNLTSNPPTGPNTLTAWIKPSVTSDTHAIVGRNSSWSTGYGYGMLIYNNNLIGMAAESNGTWWSNLRTPISANMWSHVALTFDGWGADTTGSLYVNGELKDSYTSTASMYWGYSNTIGSGDNSGRRFNGLIDDVRTYDRALSAEEIERLYQMSR
ncbi:LamG domain-containing protein, partial [Patescibacteria group bacterium]